MKTIHLTAIAAFGLAAGATTAFAVGNARISESAGRICISSNGLPEHSTGQFPNRSNPNAIRPQRVSVCVLANPKKGYTAREVNRGAIGIALNGVMIRPEAADCYDPKSPRGFSRSCRNGWHLEPMGPGNKFGLDRNNAHVDNRGLYHYHGMPSGLLASTGKSLIGYAADGFEIRYGGNMKTGWSLKKGKRPSGFSSPKGTYDGSFVEDYKYTGGGLDRCNGGMRDGKYVYFVTDSFPYYPRCLYGTQGKAFR